MYVIKNAAFIKKKAKYVDTWVNESIWSKKHLKQRAKNHRSSQTENENAIIREIRDDS